MTSLTVDEFQQFVSPFEAAFQAHMDQWRPDGRPGTAPQYTTYTNCPLPTPEDRLLFILVYLKTYALQVVHGRLFGMGQSRPNQWIHILLGILQATLCALGDAPTRSVREVVKRLGVAEADAAAVFMPTRKPRGRELTCAQKAANRRIARRRGRIEHVNSSVKRCRIVHDVLRLMGLSCALHNFRVRLTPWQAMV